MENSDYEIQDIISEDLSLPDMISKFRDWLMKESIALFGMSAVGKDVDERQEKYDSMQKAFNGLEKMYYSKMKMDKMTGHKKGTSDKAFMDKIRQQKSTIGDIIRENS